MRKLIHALREKYFDNTVDLSKLSKTFLLWGTGLVLVYIANIFLIRLIGLAAYGEYAVFMNWAALAATLVTFGWDGYLVQQVPLLPVDKNGMIIALPLLKRALRSFFILYALSLVILVALNQLSDKTFLFSKAGTLPVFLILIFLITVISYFKSILKIFHIVIPAQWLEDISKPALMLIIFLLYHNLGNTLSLSNVYLINILLYLALMIGLAVLVWRILYQKIAPANGAGGGVKWVRKCFYFMCIMLGYSFFSKMELLFLGYYSRNEDAAKYQLLLRVADLVILPDFLFNYYLPQQFSHLFAQNNYADAGKLFRNAARTIFLLQLLCLTGVAAIGYFYLKSFHLAGWNLYGLLLVLCSAQLFYSFFGSTNLVLMTSGNEKYSFMALGMVIIVEVIANILLVPAYGLMAAVYISLGSVLIYTVLLFMFVHRKLGFGFPMLNFKR